MASSSFLFFSYQNDARSNKHQISFLYSQQPYNFSGSKPDGFHPQLPIICIYHHFSIRLSFMWVVSRDVFGAGFQLNVCESHLSHACYIPLPTDTPLDLVTLVPVAVRSKTWVCGRSLAGFVGSKPLEGMDVSFVNVVCCQVYVTAKGRSVVRGWSISLNNEAA